MCQCQRSRVTESVSLTEDTLCVQCVQCLRHVGATGQVQCAYTRTVGSGGGGSFDSRRVDYVLIRMDIKFTTLEGGGGRAIMKILTMLYWFMLCSSCVGSRLCYVVHNSYICKYKYS